MNTIPTTLRGRDIPYTVVGGGKGRPGGQGLPVSVLVLCRGNRLHRSDLFAELQRAGFDSVLSIENADEAVELESMAASFPSVRFLTLKERASDGERVNIGMREASSPFVFVLWDDMRLATSTLSSRFFERLSERPRHCVVPTLSCRKGEPVPSVLAPATEDKSLRFVLLSPSKDGEKNLVPFDYCGIYARERFVLMGGFDWTISSPYWQKLDFGMRGWLWGEEIVTAQALKLNCEVPMPSEDVTPDESYARFYLKNLAVAFKGDQGMLPLSRALPFMLKSGLGPFRALAEFRAAREWVRLNRYRFRCDAAGLVDLWEPLSP